MLTTRYYIPSTLEIVFSDLVKSQLDPLLKSEYENFVKEIETHVKRGIEPKFAREKDDDDTIQTFKGIRLVFSLF